MKKEILEKVKNIGESIESGIEEMYRDEGINMEAHTIIKEKKGTLPPSVFLFQNFADKFSRMKGISPATYMVLFYFFSLQGYKNFVSTDIKTISENLSISERSVMRAVSFLLEQNIILKSPYIHDKRRYEYFINPYTTWRGKTLDRDKHIKQIEGKNPNQYQLPF